MPFDKDVFAFRLRQSGDFVCSVKWNQNRLYLNSENRIRFATIAGRSRRCDETNRGRAEWLTATAHNDIRMIGG
jgi:hypothetical protein